MAARRVWGPFSKRTVAPPQTNLSERCAHILSCDLPEIIHLELKHHRGPFLEQDLHESVSEGGALGPADLGSNGTPTRHVGLPETPRSRSLTPPPLGVASWNLPEDVPAWGTPLPDDVNAAEGQALAHLNELRRDIGNLDSYLFGSATGARLPTTFQGQCSLLLLAVVVDGVASLKSLHFIFPYLLDAVGEEALLVSLMSAESSRGLLHGSREQAARWLLSRGVGLPEGVARAYAGRLRTLQPKKALRRKPADALDYLSSLSRNRYLVLSEAVSAGAETLAGLHEIFEWLTAQLRKPKTKRKAALNFLGRALDGCLEVLCRDRYSPAVQVLHSEASAVDDLHWELTSGSRQALPDVECMAQVVVLIFQLIVQCNMRVHGDPAMWPADARGGAPADAAAAAAPPGGGEGGAQQEAAQAGPTTIFIVTDRRPKKAEGQIVGFHLRRRTDELRYAQVTFLPDSNTSEDALNETLQRWRRTPTAVPEGAKLEVWEGEDARRLWMERVRVTYDCEGDREQAYSRIYARLVAMPELIGSPGRHLIPETAHAAAKSQCGPLLVVPGFNVDWLPALQRALELQRDLERRGPVIIFSWCSNSMWGAAGYPCVRQGIRRNVPQLVDLLNFLQEELPPAPARSPQHSPGEPGAPLQLIAHSMGCQISIWALSHKDCNLFRFRDLERTRSRHVPERRQPSNQYNFAPWLGKSSPARYMPSFIFLQADVEVDKFKARASTFSLRGLPTLYCAEDDIALWGSMHIRIMNRISPRAGLYAQTSAQASRYDTVDASGFSTDPFGHSCWRHPAVVSDIREALAGTHPLEDQRKEANTPFKLVEQSGRVPRSWSAKKCIEFWKWGLIYLPKEYTLWYKLSQLH